MRTNRSAARWLQLSFSAVAGLCIGDATAQSLEGETINLVYNSAPGGSTGLGAQVLADAWSAQIAGDPTMVAQSVEGGDLGRGIYHVMEARPDGTTLGYLAWSGSTRILDPEELQIDFEQFGVIGGVSASRFFLLSSTDALGIETPEEFAELDSVQYGGFHSKSASAMRTAAALDLLGVDYNYVAGFSGDSVLLAAMMRGELDAYSATSASYTENLLPGPIADGEAIAVFHFGEPTADGAEMVPHPAFPEVDTFDAYYERVRGEPPSGPLWDFIQYHGRVTDAVTWLVVAPPETPDAVLDELRTSFKAAVEGEKFQEEAKRIFQTEPHVVYADGVSAIIEEVQSTPEETRQMMRDYIEKLSN